MIVDLVSYTQGPITTCAIAASMCYDSEPSHTVVKKCIESGHMSVLEHCSFTFKIIGVSRALLAQLTRHRLASFCVASQRYIDYSDKKIDFVISTVQGMDKVTESAQASLDTYKQLIADGVKPENARAVLPNCMPTNLVMTVNLRELATICNLRMCTHAQSEISTLMFKIRNTLMNYPNISQEDKEIFDMLLVPACETHSISFCPESKSCGRHKTLKELLEEKNAE